jgi:hypothetical protein
MRYLQFSISDFSTKKGLVFHRGKQNRGFLLLAEETEGNVMGKSMDTKKDSKKKPAKSVKEKRAEKKSKKETKGS